MTNVNAIKLALRRTGLSQTSSTYLDNGRDYLNMVVKEISQRATWEWLFKSSTITTVATQKVYSLASDVLEPLSFRNNSQDYSLIMAGPEDIDRGDPDHSDFTSSNDTDNLEVYIPLWVQPAVVAGIAEYYLQEKGAIEDAELERRRKEETIAFAMRRNGVGDRRYLLRGATSSAGAKAYTVAEGSLS